MAICRCMQSCCGEKISIYTKCLPQGWMIGLYSLPMCSALHVLVNLYNQALVIQLMEKEVYSIRYLFMDPYERFVTER